MKIDSSSKDSLIDPVVKRMLENYKLSEAADSDNRKRALYAMNFRRGGKDQWDSAIYDLRTQGNRPAESYNQIPQFLHQVTNDLRINMPQTRFIADADGDEEIAEIYEDKARTIQTASDAEVAYDNAVDNQATIGWGYWRILTEYESDDSFDQEIRIRWVPNVFMVYDDPTCVEQDFSDRGFLIEGYDIHKHNFNNDYDRDYDDNDLNQIGSASPDWATGDTVRVAEYWERTFVKTKIYRAKNKDGTYAEITETKPKVESEEREVLKPKVMWYKCTAKEVIDSKEWPGIYIPYVRVSGETQVIDGKVYYSGLVEGMIPAQKQYNHWTNTATEIMGMVPLAPWIAAVGQISGKNREAWDKSNVKKYPFLEYDPITVNGTLAGAPQRNSASADVSGALAMVQQAQQNFYTSTGIYPASLGQQSNEQSGKAIMARQREGDVSTYHFGDNFARALRFQGRIFEDLYPKVYDSARTWRLSKEDGSTRTVKINQQYKNEKGETKNYDLSKGKYKVVVTTGPSFTTKRQESAEMMTALAQSTNLMEVAPDIYFSNQDFPGSKEIAERYKRALPPALTQEEGEDQLPPQVTAQMEQMGAVIQQLETQLQQVGQELQSKEADIASKQADIQLKVQDQQLKGQSEAAKFQLDQQKLALDAEKLQLDRDKLELEAAKMQLDYQKTQMTTPQGGEDMALSKEALIAQLEALNQQEVDGQIAEQERMVHEQAHKEREADEKAYSMAKDQALLDSLSGIQSMIAGLAQTIQAPKQVVRNPETGLIEGVITQGN